MDGTLLFIAGGYAFMLGHPWYGVVFLIMFIAVALGDSL